MPNDPSRLAKRTAPLAVVTIVGVVIGLWVATKYRGVADVTQHFLADQGIELYEEDMSVPAPLVVRASWSEALISNDPLAMSPNSQIWKEGYFLWVFGRVIEL